MGVGSPADRGSGASHGRRTDSGQSDFPEVPSGLRQPRGTSGQTQWLEVVVAVQGVNPERKPSSVEYRYRPTRPQPSVPAARRRTTLPEEIANLANDYQRAVFCREKAESARRHWFEGGQGEMA